MTQLNCFLAIYVYPDPLPDQTKITSDAPSDKTLFSQNSYCNTIGQSTFISFTNCIACSLLKLKHSILLVMYNWLNSFYCDINSKYSVTLLFFASNQRHALLLRPYQSVILTASVIKKLKSSRTYLTNQIGSISCHKLYFLGKHLGPACG